MTLKCNECIFWKPGPGVRPEGWGRCALLSGDGARSPLADAGGGTIPHVATPGSFGCSEWGPAVRVLELLEVYCEICGLTVEHSIDAGCPEDAESIMETHLREHREARGEDE